MSAVLSPCRRYRYRLDRHTLIDSPCVVAWIMVNPSTADEVANDQTISKVRGFSTRFGFGRFVVGNLFAWRATDVRELRTAPDPIGPENNAHLVAIMGEADTVIVAWGRNDKLPRELRTRWFGVVRLARDVGKPLSCLGTAADGHPLHPLTLGYHLPLEPWSTP